jgi:hypothetical protein
MSFIFKMMLILYQSVSISGSISIIYWHASKCSSISFSHWQCPSDREFSFPLFVDLLIQSLWFMLWLIYTIINILLLVVFCSYWELFKNITKWVTMFFLAGVDLTVRANLLCYCISHINYNSDVIQNRRT